MKSLNNINTDIIINVIRESHSVSQVIDKLNLTKCGSVHSAVKNYIKANNINTDHFTGQGWNKNTYIPRVNLDVYFTNSKPIQSNKLRKRLLKDGYFKHQCSSCNLTEWLGKPIALELDHIDGVNTNNSPDNLRLLCPNCHAQTTTYRGKNIKRKPKLSSGLPD